MFAGTVAKNLRLADPALSDTAVGRLLAMVALDRSGVGRRHRVGAGGRRDRNDAG